ncbi:MAG TPA: phosphoglycerate kinase [Gammaproteobacteria bacterium]
MIKMKSIDDFDCGSKTVLLRVDINSPIDPESRKIVNENRIRKSLPTIRKLLDSGAKLAIIAHQGDTLDYQNLISMEEHAEKLSAYLGTEVDYIDDVAGPAAQDRVRNLQPGEAVLLGNLRYLSEEISTFENAVKLEPDEMLETYLVRGLAPLVDIYVNDAFAAAHRNAPSMVAFQELKPTAAGDLLFEEVSALSRVMLAPEHPSVFVLGGAKISDAFGMMKQVLESGTADKILTCGVTGEVFLMAKGYRLGPTKEKFLADRSLDVFVDDARSYLNDFGDKIQCPEDLAYEKGGERQEVTIDQLPIDEMFMDIGKQTAANYQRVIAGAKTLFVNGPAGVYENPIFSDGTAAIWNAIASSSGYSVIGGGDTVTAATRFVDLDDIDYVCTAGGAMVRYLSGKKLPLMLAMEKAFERDSA